MSTQQECLKWLQAGRSKAIAEAALQTAKTKFYFNYPAEKVKLITNKSQLGKSKMNTNEAQQ